MRESEEDQRDPSPHKNINNADSDQSFLDDQEEITIVTREDRQRAKFSSVTLEVSKDERDGSKRSQSSIAKASVSNNSDRNETDHG